jgi:hypothetical protein
VAEHEAASMAAELPAGHKVDHGVLTGEDPAKRCLAGCRHDAAEGPDHAGISSGLPVCCCRAMASAGRARRLPRRCARQP